MKKHYKIVLAAVCLLLVLLVGWTIWGNSTVGLTTITVTEKNLPYAFNGFRIAQVSDLHNSDLWEKAIVQLNKADPDIIVITGDIVDAKRTDIAQTMAFIAQAIQIADCFYVSGNHEMNISSEEYAILTEGMKQMGVYILEDTQVSVHRNGSYIALAGHGWGDTASVRDITDFDGYRILLSHQPEGMEDYVKAGYDLVFSGHAHGGQIRIPFLGGIFAPGQGLFPKYDSGHYTQGRTDLIVSRGIGNSSFPIRFNNRPEVVLVILENG